MVSQRPAGISVKCLGNRNQTSAYNGVLVFCFRGFSSGTGAAKHRNPGRRTNTTTLVHFATRAAPIHSPHDRIRIAVPHSDEIISNCMRIILWWSTKVLTKILYGSRTVQLEWFFKIPPELVEQRLHVYSLICWWLCHNTFFFFIVLKLTCHTPTLLSWSELTEHSIGRKKERERIGVGRIKFNIPWWFHLGRWILCIPLVKIV